MVRLFTCKHKRMFGRINENENVWKPQVRVYVSSFEFSQTFLSVCINLTDEKRKWRIVIAVKPFMFYRNCAIFSAFILETTFAKQVCELLTKEQTILLKFKTQLTGIIYCIFHCHQYYNDNQWTLQIETNKMDRNTPITTTTNETHWIWSAILFPEVSAEMIDVSEKHNRWLSAVNLL